MRLQKPKGSSLKKRRDTVLAIGKCSQSQGRRQGEAGNSKTENRLVVAREKGFGGLDGKVEGTEKYRLAVTK